MFHSVYNFCKRHRNKIIYAGLLAGSGYVLSKFVLSKIEEWQMTKISEMERDAKRHYLFETTQKNCTMTILSLLPNVRDVITSKINLDHYLQLLKLKPLNKVEIWEEVKVLSMAQMLSSIVASVVLIAFLKVQFNILGGLMFLDLDEKNSTIAKHKERFLNAIQFFISKGMPALIDEILTQAREVVSNISLAERLSFDQMKEVTVAISQNIQASSLKDSTLFASYMIDSDWWSSEEAEDYDLLLTQFSEILKSTNNVLVMKECVSVGLDAIFENIKPSFMKMEDAEAIVSLESCTKTNEMKLPLAKVAPLLNLQVHEIFKEGPNNFLDGVFSHRLLREFSDYVFDAFSHHYRS